MIKTNLPIYLASKSPRRRKLLRQINIEFKSFSVDVEEKIKRGEKPSQSVKKFIKKLSGRVHTVYTGFSVFNSEKELLVTDYEKTLVEFRKLSQNEIDDYIKSGSPLDKAGAYGIQ